MKNILKLALLLVVGLCSSAVVEAKSHHHKKTPVVFFTPMDLDDPIALILLCKAPNIDLKAVYVIGDGFSDAGATVQGVYNILDWMGHNHTKVVIGSFYSKFDTQQQLNFIPFTFTPITFQTAVPAGDGGRAYADNLWGNSTYLPVSKRHYTPALQSDPATQSDDVIAAQTIQEIIRTSERPVTLLSTGPMTAVNNVIFTDFTGTTPAPGVLSNIKKLVQGGGAYNLSPSCEFGNGNLFDVHNTSSEFNFYSDPIAASDVFTAFADAGVKIEEIPLDGTNQVPFNCKYLNEVIDSAKTPEAEFSALILYQVARTWFEPACLSTLYIWDVIYAMTLIDPSIISETIKDVAVTIETDQNCTPSVTLDFTSDPGCSILTTTTSTSIGTTTMTGSGNVTLVTNYHTTGKRSVYSKIIELLNSKENSALTKLKKPVGLYKYEEFHPNLKPTCQLKGCPCAIPPLCFGEEPNLPCDFFPHVSESSSSSSD